MKSFISRLIKGISPWNIILNQILSTLKYLTRLLLNLPTWLCVKNVLEVRGSVLFSVSVLNRHLHLQRQPWNGKINVWNLKIPARHCSGFLIQSFKQASQLLWCFHSWFSASKCQLGCSFFILADKQLNLKFFVN